MVDADFKEEDTLGIQNPLLSPALLGQEWLQRQFLSPLGAVSLLGIYRISGLQPEPEIESISSNNSLAISSLNQESVQDWRTSKATDNSSKVRASRTVPIQRKLVQNVETIADHKSEVQPNTQVAQHETVDFSIEPKAKIISAEVDQPKLTQQEIIQRTEAITPDIQSVAEPIAHSNPETRQVNQNIDFIVKRNSTSITDTQPGLIQREAIQKSEVIAFDTQGVVDSIAHSDSETRQINQNENIDFIAEKNSTSITNTQPESPELIQREAIQKPEVIAFDTQGVVDSITHSDSETRQLNQNENIDFIAEKNSTSITNTQPE
ncbi:hypothetical protein ACKFKH_07830, partial [Phormidesmis sp. 146-20]